MVSARLDAPRTFAPSSASWRVRPCDPRRARAGAARRGHRKSDLHVDRRAIARVTVGQCADAFLGRLARSARRGSRRKSRVTCNRRHDLRRHDGLQLREQPIAPRPRTRRSSPATLAHAGVIITAQAVERRGEPRCRPARSRGARERRTRRDRWRAPAPRLAIASSNSFCALSEPCDEGFAASAGAFTVCASTR